MELAPVVRVGTPEADRTTSEVCLSAVRGKCVRMLTILLLILIVLLLTGGIGYGFRGRRGV